MKHQYSITFSITNNSGAGTNWPLLCNSSGLVKLL